MHIADRIENVKLEIHRPVRKNIALECTEPWEYETGYLGILKIGDMYRLYYRAREKDFFSTYKNRFCYAESRDGKTFTHPSLGMHEFGGSTDNNIYFQENRVVDNFSVFYDENPDCPEDEKFKALSQDSGGSVMKLLYYKSADGIHFEKVGALDVPGVFDSYNILFWDEAAEEYKMYIRDFHRADGSQMQYIPSEEVMKHAYRDVRLTRSKDFIHWTKPEMIRFSDGDIHTQLYTGMIFRYKRADIYLGLPTRYNNRPDQNQNYKYLPGWNGQRKKFIDAGSRIGTVFNDTGIMTSHDGLNFDKWNGAYMTTGMERHDNWAYMDCYPAYDIVETDSDWDGDVKEISLYRPEGWHASGHRIVRYTVRLDGFYSWHSGGSGGSVTTVPLTFEGNSLEINFATSSLGSVRILICDEGGNAMDGYDSGILFGDSAARPVDFEKPLDLLNGRTVRIRFELEDADLYSFRFQ